MVSFWALSNCDKTVISFWGFQLTKQSFDQRQKQSHWMINESPINGKKIKNKNWAQHQPTTTVMLLSH